MIHVTFCFHRSHVYHYFNFMPRVCFKHSLSEDMMCAMSAVMFRIRLQPKICVIMWMNNYVDRSCVRHLTSSVVSYFSGGLLVCHCYTSRRWIAILSVPFVGYCFLWCVSYVRSRISWMGCLHISNRYSRIWFGYVLSSCTSFFQML